MNLTLLVSVRFFVVSGIAPFGVDSPRGVR